MTFHLTNLLLLTRKYLHTYIALTFQITEDRKEIKLRNIVTTAFPEDKTQWSMVSAALNILRVTT